MEQERLAVLRMTFHERLRSIEERYGMNESEHARELGRVVAHLQD